MRRLAGLLVFASVFAGACATEDPGDAAGSTPSAPTVPAPGVDERGDDGDATRVVTTPAKADLPVIDPFGQGAIELMAADGTVTCSCVLIADQQFERNQGLMNVTDLQGYAGMVFTWPDDVTSQFVMRDTPMPLSIAWFTADGSLVSTTDMEPCIDGGACPTYRADGPYRFAFEVPQGELGAVGVADGATFRLVDDCDG